MKAFPWKSKGRKQHHYSLHSMVQCLTLAMIYMNCNTSFYWWKPRKINFCFKETRKLFLQIFSTKHRPFLSHGDNEEVDIRIKVTLIPEAKAFRTLQPDKVTKAFILYKDIWNDHKQIYTVFQAFFSDAHTHIPSSPLTTGLSNKFCQETFIAVLFAHDWSVQQRCHFFDISKVLCRTAHQVWKNF